MSIARIMFFALGLLVTGCAPTGTAVTWEGIERMSDERLWMHFELADDFTVISMLEAELASRGQFGNIVRFIGEDTANRVGKKAFQRDTHKPSDPENKDYKNCSDFNSSVDAQVYFLKSGGPELDPSRLDADGDGFACEWGTRVKSNSRAMISHWKTPSPATNASTHRATRSSSTIVCHTGPRGGRFAYAANGRKDYSAC